MTLQQARRLIKITLGVMLLVAGTAMLVLPGPGIVVIALALAVLGGEYIWARRLLERINESVRRVRDAFGQRQRT